MIGYNQWSGSWYYINVLECKTILSFLETFVGEVFKPWSFCLRL